jgi:hypothetical protein
VAYRDDQQALILQVSALEQENERLRQQLEASEDRHRRTLADQHTERRKGIRYQCLLCGGNLHAVAIIAGHDVRNPLPLKMSTLRFGDPTGGFTASAPVRSYACSSCGYIHSFIDMDDGKDKDKDKSG